MTQKKTIYTPADNQRAKTLEEKAQAYAEKVFCDAVELYTESPWNKFRDTYAAAYLAGATEALASQWVSVEERLPEEHEEVLTYSIAPQYAEDENAVAYHDGEDWHTTDGKHIRPHYWLPIPPLKGGDA